MIAISIDQDQITRLTEEYEGQWGINHTRRLLHLISHIGEGQQYNAEALWMAAHLRDWGAYAPWLQKGVDHALRSRQVAETFLTENGCDGEMKSLVLECIEFHHSAGSDKSIEALLLRDADALDFLGTVGILRDFSRKPKDLRSAYETCRQRQENLANIFYFENAKNMAIDRLIEMDIVLAAFAQECFGCY